MHVLFYHTSRFQPFLKKAKLPPFFTTLSKDVAGPGFHNASTRPAAAAAADAAALRKNLVLARRWQHLYLGLSAYFKYLCYHDTHAPLPPPALQIPLQKLRPPKPKTPILPLVPRNTDNEVLRRNTALGVQARGQRGIRGLFLLGVAALLEDLDEEEFVGADEAQVCVFHYEFVGFVLGYYLWWGNK